jgi:hypothetical protein
MELEKLIKEIESAMQLSTCGALVAKEQAARIFRLLPSILSALREQQRMREAGDKTTVWFCEKCLESGAFTHDQHIDTWGGYQRVVDSHKTHSPECNFDNNKVRILIGAGDDVDFARAALAMEVKE